jgi:hypothetical protein
MFIALAVVQTAALPFGIIAGRLKSKMMLNWYA